MAKAEYKDRKYHVQPYNPAWPKQFETDAKVLKGIFGDDTVAIEHIGSTSVPGMDGKPTIDILILVNDLAVADKHVAAMKDAGYEHLVGYVSPDSVLFRKMKDNTLLSNVHVFQKDHPHVREMLTLRNYLRSHPEEVTAYSDLKKELFQKYPDDYATYRKLKDEYMVGLKSRAAQPANLKFEVADSVPPKDFVMIAIKAVEELYKKKPWWGVVSDIISAIMGTLGLVVHLGFISSIAITLLSLILTHWFANREYKKVK
jgi:GrpB-like predicted nucleotidyltransferase (UPF0157 family)